MGFVVSENESVDRLGPSVTVGSVILFEFVPLLDAGISPHRTDVDHSVTELNKSATFFRELHVRNILEAEVHQLLILILTEPLDETITGKGFSEAVCGQAVFGKGEIEEGGNWRRGCAELFLLFSKVGATDLGCVRTVGLWIRRIPTNPIAHLWRN